MKIIHLPPAALKPYKNNPRINAPAVDAVAASIRQFGFRQPIVVDARRVIIAGHTRWLAAKLLRLKTVPVHVARDLSPAQVRAYRLADNRTAELAPWDFSKLAAELDSLDADLKSALDALDFDALLAQAPADPKPGLTDPDDIPAPPKKLITKPGDLWLLGNHRLLCGDSTKPDDVARVMAGEKAALCFTSPPYLQQRDYTAASDCSDWDGLMQGVFGNLAMTDDGQVLVNLGLVYHDNVWIQYWDSWLDWMQGRGWRRFAWYVWDQGFGLPGSWAGRLSPSHEFIFHLNKARRMPNRWVEKKPDSITPTGRCGALRTDTGKIKDFSSPLSGLNTHKIADSVIRVFRQQGPIAKGVDFPAPFSVGLPAHILQCFTAGLDIVFDPFLGSGTTMIAAEQLGRRCYGIEIEPRYVDVAVRRWEDFTGNKAVRETEVKVAKPKSRKVEA